MSAEPKPPIETDEETEVPFVWDGPGVVTYDPSGAIIIYVTHEESRMLWEQQVRDELGIEPGEFLRRLDAGEYGGEEIDWPENWHILRLAMRRPDQK